MLSALALLWLGVVIGLLLHDRLVVHQSERLLAASELKGRVLDGTGAWVRGSDAWVLDVCGYVPPQQSLQWLRLELNQRWPMLLPSQHRGSARVVGMTDEELRAEMQPRILKHMLTACWGVLSLCAGAAGGVVIMYGRRWRHGVRAALSVRKWLPVVWLVCAGMACGPAAFYFGYNRLHVGGYGAGAFVPPLEWFAPVSGGVGLLASYTLWACLFGRSGARSGGRHAAQCVRCGCTTCGEVCAECGERCSSALIRSVERRRARVVLTGVASAIVVVGGTRVLLMQGPLESKAKYAVRWLTLRPTNYSTTEGFFVRVGWW